MIDPTWAIVAATLLGPVFAVQAQKWIERAGAKKERRIRIFRTLMSTRATTLAPDHIAALNAVPLDFEKGKAADEPVLAQWRLYMAHVGTPVEGDHWPRERQNRLINLLEAMGKHLGLKFDRAELEVGIYAPVHQGQVFDETERLRKGALALLEGKKPLVVDNAGAYSDAGKRYAALLLEVLEGKRPIRIAPPRKQSIGMDPAKLPEGEDEE